MAANSDIGAGDRGIAGHFIQGFASKETNESRAGDSGEPALIQSTSSHKGIVANLGEPFSGCEKNKIKKKIKEKKEVSFTATLDVI